jgi:hypothetical protein
MALHTTTHRNEHNPCEVKKTVTNDNFWYIVVLNCTTFLALIL